MVNGEKKRVEKSWIKISDGKVSAAKGWTMKNVEISDEKWRKVFLTAVVWWETLLWPSIELSHIFCKCTKTHRNEWHIEKSKKNFYCGPFIISWKSDVKRLLISAMYKFYFTTAFLSCSMRGNEWRIFPWKIKYDTLIMAWKSYVVSSANERKRIVALLWHLKPSCCRIEWKYLFSQAAGWFNLVLFLFFLSLHRRKHMPHKDISQFFWSDKMNSVKASSASIFI